VAEPDLQKTGFVPSNQVHHCTSESLSDFSSSDLPGRPSCCELCGMQKQLFNSQLLLQHPYFVLTKLQEFHLPVPLQEKRKK
jgi:hypothetical protein